MFKPRIVIWADRAFQRLSTGIVNSTYQCLRVFCALLIVSANFLGLRRYNLEYLNSESHLSLARFSPSPTRCLCSLLSTQTQNPPANLQPQSLVKYVLTRHAEFWFSPRVSWTATEVDGEVGYDRFSPCRARLGLPGRAHPYKVTWIAPFSWTIPRRCTV